MSSISTETIIDSFRILKEIGRGGMAVIYQVEHIDTKEIFALKLLSNPDNQKSFQSRFEQEFKALCRLSHPNVLKVLGCGEYRGSPYFTMELLQGKTLKDVIPEWMKLSPNLRFAKATNVLIQMSKALDHIHQRGWIHRDITPSNIMVLENDQIKLMDFGVIKMPGTEQTMMGEIIGTVAYMSPEQIQNDVMDSRADLYSLGATLYLMITGERPFEARTLAGYLKKHLQEDPEPPSTTYPMIPEKLEKTCLRLLKKSPDQRFASANHLLLYLSDDAEKQRSRRLFGRTKELHLLQERIANLSLQKGGVVLLQGSAGMGKSKLLQSCSDILQQFDIPYSFCNNHNPQQPMYDGFRGLLREISPSSREYLLNQQGTDSDQWEFFPQVRKHLDPNIPRCILFDNIEKSDVGTQKLLEFLMFSMLEEGLPILFIITVNSDETTIMDGILHRKPEDIPIHTIPVAPIQLGAVEEWLLSVAVDDHHVHQLAQRLQEESEGVPLIVDEMLRTLEKQGIIDTTTRTHLHIPDDDIEAIPLPLPNSIHTSFVERIADLADVKKLIIHILSISKRELIDNVLLETVQLFQTEFVQIPPIHPLQFHQYIEELSDIDVAQYHEVHGSRQVALIHMWLREIVTSQISLETQKQYHYCLGSILEQYYQQNISRVVENLAYHFEQAEIPGKAYAYLQASARKMRQRSLFHEAIGYLDRSIEVEKIARKNIALYEANEKLAEIFLWYSSFTYNIGEHILAKEKANQADALAGEQQNYALLAKVAIEKAFQARDTYDLREADLQITRALNYAEKSQQPSLCIRPLYEKGALLWDRGLVEQAQIEFQKSLELSQQFQDIFGMAKVNNGLGVLSMSLGNSNAAKEYFEIAIEYANQSRKLEVLAVSQTNLSELLHCIGYFKKSLQLLNKTIKECREARYYGGLCIALRHSAVLLTDLGKYAEAEEHIKLSLSYQEKELNKHEYLANLVALIRYHLSLHQWTEIAKLLSEAMDLVEKYDSEGYTSILLAWQARMIFMQSENIDIAEDILQLAVEKITHNRKFQEVRSYLSIAKSYMVCQNPDKSILYAQAALDIANIGGYRYYTMRARQILSTLTVDKVEQSRHQRVAEALARSLASSLSESDASYFLERNLVMHT